MIREQFASRPTKFLDDVTTKESSGSEYGNNMARHRAVAWCAMGDYGLAGRIDI